jgi:hypothetical protein
VDRTVGSGISTLISPLVAPSDSFPDHRFQDLPRDNFGEGSYAPCERHADRGESSQNPITSPGGYPKPAIGPRVAAPQMCGEPQAIEARSLPPRSFVQTTERITRSRSISPLVKYDHTAKFHSRGIQGDHSVEAVESPQHSPSSWCRV